MRRSDCGGRVPASSNLKVGGPSRNCTAKLVVHEPPKDGSWHATDVELVHALVPHAVWMPTVAEGVGSFAPKLSPVIVTEVPPPATVVGV